MDYNVPYEVDLGVPETVLNNDQMLAVTKWFCENVITSHPQAAGIPAHFEMDWINIFDENFLALSHAAPNLSYIRRTVHGARIFFQIMQLQQVKTVA